MFSSLFINNSEFVAGIAMVVYGFSGFFMINWLKENKKQKRDSFFNALYSGLKSNSIQTYEDLINVYKGVSRLGSEDINYRISLSNWLRQFFVEIICGDKFRIEEKDLHRFEEIIKKFIKTNDEASPFADLPDVERSILSDVVAFIEAGDISSVRRKINELGGIIQTRYEEHKKLQRSNKWSIPLAVIGLFLSIIFGIMPFVVSSNS